jgi:hypothetical protein
MTARFSLAADGEAATRCVTDALVRRGFRVVRSFDLRSAVAGHHACACPHHDTAQCTCQYVVLLAYPTTGGPVVVTAHSCDATAELQIVEDPNAPTNPATSRLVMDALGEAVLAETASQVATEVGAC